MKSCMPIKLTDWVKIEIRKMDIRRIEKNPNNPIPVNKNKFAIKNIPTKKTVALYSFIGDFH